MVQIQLQIQVQIQRGFYLFLHSWFHLTQSKQSQLPLPQL